METPHVNLHIRAHIPLISCPGSLGTGHCRWTLTRARIRARLGGGIPRRSMAGQNFSTITPRGTLKTISVKAIIAQSNDSFGAAFGITNIESLIFVESLFVFPEVNLRLTVVATEQISQINFLSGLSSSLSSS